MRTSYSADDVTLLLKDVTGCIEAFDTHKREKMIQSGIHYSEMLPLEYKPSPVYLGLYNEAVKNYAQKTAYSVMSVAEKIFLKKGKNAVLVSLARAGTPVGILIKRYLKLKYNINVFHYSISIIRGRGIDENALKYIFNKHDIKNIQFIDGWIGKGAIINELKKEVKKYKGLDGSLAVLSDPSGLSEYCGTREDFLIPSACLNATVSGLFSRTILNSNIIGKDDFHGAVYFKELENEDVSNDFLKSIEEYFLDSYVLENTECFDALNEVDKILNEFKISDINFIKPGIGETTRVLLRRIPWKILVKDINDEKYIGHIKRLCSEKNVKIEEYDLKSYRAVGIIKNLNDI